MVNIIPLDWRSTSPLKPEGASLTQTKCLQLYTLFLYILEKTICDRTLTIFYMFLIFKNEALLSHRTLGAALGPRFQLPSLVDLCKDV
jgi:hypothetical protein